MASMVPAFSRCHSRSRLVSHAHMSRHLRGAVEAHLPVLGISGDLLAVIIGAALPLAVQISADGLSRLIFRKHKGLLTVATMPFHHTGVVAPRLNRLWIYVTGATLLTSNQRRKGCM